MSTHDTVLRGGEARLDAHGRQRPMWISRQGVIDPAAHRLLHLLDTAHLDGLDERSLDSLRTEPVRRDLDLLARGNTEAAERADRALSELFITYVRAMRSAGRGDMSYESPALAPALPTPQSVLASARKATSLQLYLDEMGWMHPLYAPLRKAAERQVVEQGQRRLIIENLARVRALPATPPERYVLVDAAGARLWMYEGSTAVDSMRVVVGRPETPTPAMAGFLRYAILNPYWNVPPDLVRRTVARGVVERGMGFLEQNSYEVLSDYGDNPEVIDPATVDWKAVAAGAPPPRVRQKPGGSNFMGEAKFEFPNPEGIYLHDTPERGLLELEQRQLSNGCVRLEDARRFGQWLLGRSISQAGGEPEQRIDLPTLVPVYITYLTAFPAEGGEIAFRDDVYGRDGTSLIAQIDRPSAAPYAPREAGL